MNVLIVYAHPEPTSFTGALKDAAVRALATAGHQVEVSDLYAEGFNPVAGRHDFTGAADPARFHYQSEQLHASRTGSFAALLGLTIGGESIRNARPKLGCFAAEGQDRNGLLPAGW